MKRLFFVLMATIGTSLQANQLVQLEQLIINSDVQNFEFMVNDILITEQMKEHFLELCQDMINKRLQDLASWNASVDKAHSLCPERIIHDNLLTISKGLIIGGIASAAFTLLSFTNPCSVTQKIIPLLSSASCFLASMWAMQAAKGTVVKKRRYLENMYTNAVRIKQILHSITPVATAI